MRVISGSPSRKNADTVYAFVTNEDWAWGTQKTFTLKSVKATAETTVRVLGQNEIVLEYRPDVTPKTEFEQTTAGLRITAYRAQRLYNDRHWPNPVVLKITHAAEGLRPPVVVTGAGAEWGARGATLSAELKDLGDASSIDVGFEYRKKKSTAEMYEPDDPWKMVGRKMQTLSAPAEFSADLSKVDIRRDWEYRAVAKHPKVTLYGITQTLAAK